MRKPTIWTKIAGALLGRSRGFTLIEVLVALALVGIIAITFAGGLSTASQAALTGDIRATAESLARSQMEYVRSQVYHEAPWSYEVDHEGSECTCEGDDRCPGCSDYALESEYAGYRVKVKAELLPRPDPEEPWYPYIQEITVTVFHDSGDTRVIGLVGYRTDVE